MWRAFIVYSSQWTVEHGRLLCSIVSYIIRTGDFLLLLGLLKLCLLFTSVMSVSTCSITVSTSTSNTDTSSTVDSVSNLWGLCDDSSTTIHINRSTKTSTLKGTSSVGRLLIVIESSFISRNGRQTANVSLHLQFQFGYSVLTGKLVAWPHQFSTSEGFKKVFLAIHVFARLSVGVI